MLVKFIEAPGSEWERAQVLGVTFVGPDKIVSKYGPEFYGLNVEAEGKHGHFFVDEGTAELYSDQGELLETFDLAGCREKNRAIGLPL